MFRPILVSAVLLFPLTPVLRAHDATAEMEHAAKAFLSSLTDEQKSKAVMDFTGEERTNWHFIPRPRKGLPIKEMTQEQRLLAHGLLATGLSHRGYTKAVSIMSLESILAILEKGKTGSPVRDPEMYFVSIFGQPGKYPWGWRVEGHHLSLNFTAATDGARRAGGDRPGPGPLRRDEARLRERPPNPPVDSGLDDGRADLHQGE